MFKDLLLNRDLIEKDITLFVNENYSNGKVTREEKSKTMVRFNIYSDEKKYFIDLYFNNKGGSTINISNGKETEEKTKLANYIKANQKSITTDKNEYNRSVLFKKILFQDYIAFLELIKENTDLCSSMQILKDDGKENIQKLQSTRQDSVTLTYNKNTKNLRVQGRPLYLFNELFSYFNELVDVSGVVDNLVENYKFNITLGQIEEQYKHILKNSYDKHTDKLKKSLYKSIFNLNLDKSEVTCTELTFEVLRALEGHIKLTFLRDYEIESPNKWGTLIMFKYCDETDTVNLKPEYKNIIKCDKKINYYEKAYKHYVVYRHNIFHWDYPTILEADQTVHIDDINDAKNIIRDTLLIIDEYYNI